MEKWASKWLEMHSQRHIFKKKNQGEVRPPIGSSVRLSMFAL